MKIDKSLIIPISICPIYTTAKNLYKAHKLGEAQKDVFEKSGVISEDMVQKHQEYAKLSMDSVFEGKAGSIEPYIKVITKENAETGFSSSVYYSKEEDEVVISYRSTSNKEGVESDVQMIEGELPNQYEDAISIYLTVKEHFPNSKITLTGHSLGGSLAQLVASTFDDTNAVTFDCFGTKQIIENANLKDNKNCINYVVQGSIVSGVTPHPGLTRTVTPDKTKTSLVPNIKTTIVQNHDLSNFDDLQNTRYANEKVEIFSRGVSHDALMKPLGAWLKITPGSKKFISGFFFNKDGKEDKAKKCDCHA